MDKLKQNGIRILKKISEVRQKHAEAERLLAILEMEARLMCQEIDPGDVQSYGYDPQQDDRYIPGQCKISIYNVVNLKDGKRIEIEPIPIPQQ